MKIYCLNCGKEVTETNKPCECGGRTFAIGEITFNGMIRCKCGSSNFNLCMHSDGTNYTRNTYVCYDCGNDMEIKSLRIDKRFW